MLSSMLLMGIIASLAHVGGGVVRSSPPQHGRPNGLPEFLMTVHSGPSLKDLEELDTLHHDLWRRTMTWSSQLPEGKLRTRSRRSTTNVPCSVLNYVFHFYHKAVQIALAEQRDLATMAKLNKTLMDQMQELDAVVQSIFKGNESIVQLETRGQASLLLIKEPLSPDLSTKLDNDLFDLQLKVVKQIVTILDLSPKDFDIDVWHPPSHQVMQYLFGRMYRLPKQTPFYLELVSRIYQLVRQILNEGGQNGTLTAGQTVLAKSTINDLNRKAETSIIQAMKLGNTTSKPEELIELVQNKRNNNSLEADVAFEINELIYFYHLKAIKRLVAIMHLNNESLPLPQETPQELVQYIFSLEANRNTLPSLVARHFGRISDKEDEIPVSPKSLAPVQETPLPDASKFFCMECFHRAYTTWKISRSIVVEDSAGTTRERRWPVSDIGGLDPEGHRSESNHGLSDQ